jgi:hypothetical protein
MKSKFAVPDVEELTTPGTLEFTVKSLEEHFDLHAQGYRCQTRDVWQVVVAAAAQNSTIEASCADLEGAPCANTVRGYINDQLTTASLTLLQEQANSALQSQLPTWLSRQLPQGRHSRHFEVALDLHDEPYYGKADLQASAPGEGAPGEGAPGEGAPGEGAPGEGAPGEWICRGEARAGTTRFFRCATAYLMHQGVRVTLAVAFVHPAQSLCATVQHLVQRVQALGLKRFCLYLDKAFCSVPVLRYLQEQTDLSAIIATPVRGKKGGVRGKKGGVRGKKGGVRGKKGGVRALCQGRKSYHTRHTFCSPQWGEITVPVSVVRTRQQRRDGSWRVMWLVYVTLGVGAKPVQVRERYRRRFGIESSYRLLEQVRIKTTSNNAAFRFLCLAVALLLNNIRIALHWLHLRVPGAGPRRVADKLLTLERLARFLLRAIQAIYGVIDIIKPPQPKIAIY